MAIIQYSGLVNEIRGALNGSTLNKSKTIMTVSNKGVPSRSITEEQSVSRARFQRIQTTWKNLTPAQQADWALLAENVPNINRFGEEVVLSGYNKYIEASINADLIGSFISYPLNTSPLSSPLFDDILLQSVETVTYPDGTRAINIRFSLLNGQFANHLFVCDISKPLSRGLTAFHGSWRFMGEVQVSGTGANVLITSRDLPASWQYQDGDRIAVRIYSMILGRGLVNYERVWLRDVGSVPIITSFTSTSYSRNPPRTYSIVFANKSLIDGVNYVFEVRSPLSSSSECVIPPVDSPVSVPPTEQLLAVGSFTSNYVVAAGLCQTIEARIVRVSDGSIISLMYFFINQ